jgi:tetratricopeptide (TPR) repeat protein
VTESDTTTLPEFGHPGRFADRQIIAGRFVVVRYIARGGMGEVYEVEDRFLQNVHVAMKVIAPEILGDADSARRLEQEVLLARKVTHPNLCPIYDIARADDPPPAFVFLTMKLLSGETLAARLSQPGLISPQEAITILCQIAAGLEAIHAAGIIHRDIKPNNVILEVIDERLCVSITDFGLARLHDPEATLGSPSMLAGTPGYMAPELLRGEGPSRATDLFAFGVLMHWVIAGQRPLFRGTGLVLEATAALDDAKLPAIFAQTARDLLSSDPAQRCEAFDRFKATVESHRSTGSWQPGLAVRPVKGPISRRWFVTGSVLAAGGLAGGIWWKRESLFEMLHPLPEKRFVVLTGWPSPTDPRLESAVVAVIDAIGSELARAEAFDRDLYVVPRHVSKDVVTMKQLHDLGESFGANLVLSAFAVMAGPLMELRLSVLDPGAGKTLREKTITVDRDDQLSLPGRAVRAAAELLNVAKLQLDDQRNTGGTSDPKAYAAFQEAEGLRVRESDGALEASIEAYKRAVDLDPRYALAEAKLSYAYFRLYILHRDPGNLVLASANCHSALSKSPNLVDGHLALAQVLEWTGDKPGALREISTALMLDHRNPSTLLLQGQEFTRLNRWSDAEETFAQLQSLRPNFWLAHEELGIALSDEGKFARAAEEFRAAAILNARRSLPWANLSTVLLSMGDVDGALDAAKKSLAIEADDVALVRMAAVLRCQGKTDEALSYSLKAIASNPDEPGNWMDLADLYALKKKQSAEKNAFEKSVHLLEGMVRTDGADGPVLMSLALSQAKTDRRDECIKSLTSAEKNFAGDLESQLTKLRVQVLLHKPEEALATASACLKRGATPFQLKWLPDIDELRNDVRFKGLLSSSAG